MPWPGPARVEQHRSRHRAGLNARPALAVTLAGLIIAVGGFAVAGPTVAVPGAGLVVLGLLAPAWVLAVLGGLRVNAQAVSETVTDGQPWRVEITVSGSRLLGPSGVELRHALLDEPVRLRRAGRYEISARAHGRGYLEVGPPTVSVSDPIGLASAARGSQDPVGTLLVLPRTEPVRWLDGAGEAAAGAQAARAAGLQSIDIAGLRDYQTGTPATRIHWPALARGGELLERVLAHETERVPLLAVDPRCADPRRDGAVLDVVIAAAASLALSLARNGAVDLLLPGRATPWRISATLGGWPGALRALALLPVAPLTATPPRVGAGDDRVLYYACTDPAVAVAARQRWAGRMLTLSPPLAGAPAARPPATLFPGGPGFPGGRGPEAVLEVAGCVARPLWGRR
jgi:uncharacterized protein (DUF58 family)